MSTSTSACSISRVQTPTSQRPHPLLAVMGWEVRRYRASRLFLSLALAPSCFLVLLTWAEATHPIPDRAFSDRAFSAFIPGTSAWGLLTTLPITQVLLVVLVPFITADGVARDLQRRTHELLMSTALPSWAYVWGRYLTGLLMSLGLAVLLLVSILGVGTVLHVTVANYPAPELGTVLVLWVGMVVPATVLVCSLGFAIVTLFPRLSATAKVVILVAWVVGVLVLPGLIYPPSGPGTLPTGYSAWDPTSAITANTLAQHYQLNFSPQNPVPAASAQLQQVVNTIANKAPDVSTWLAPHLIEAALSLVLVAVAALGFQRFRNAVKG
jgi:ABC-type transport system involved in multi-copper enzyme maturation permease subunit